MNIDTLDAAFDRPYKFEIEAVSEYAINDLVDIAA